MVDRDKDWEFHLRSLSATARDSNFSADPASDPNLLPSVCSLYHKSSHICIIVHIFVFSFLFWWMRFLCVCLFDQVRKLYELCKSEESEDLVARVYPQINKIFQRLVASVSQSRTSNGLLFLVCAFL